MRPLDRTADGWRDRWLGEVYQTRMQFVNAVFRHKYAYDTETLVLIVREAGFADAIVQQFGISIDPKMARIATRGRRKARLVFLFRLI